MFYAKTQKLYEPFFSKACKQNLKLSIIFFSKFALYTLMLPICAISIPQTEKIKIINKIPKNFKILFMLGAFPNIIVSRYFLFLI